MEKKQTSVEWLMEKLMYLDFHPNTLVDVLQWIEQAKQMEEAQIKDAIMYSLDEDGHTGEWKIKFADNYIKKLKNG